MTTELYLDHVRERQRRAEAALAATGFEALVIQSGTPFTYFADDMDAPFHTTPHFASWVPLAGPHHLLLVRPDARPRLVRVHPEDYWYEQAPLGQPFWLEAFDLEEVPGAPEAWKRLDGLDSGRTAYVGDAPAEAAAAGIPAASIQPAELVARLDWDRSTKTAYEVACVEEATRKAARGHVAARQAFEQGASELGIHHAYVQATGCTDEELPYPSIIALDEKGATLHYHVKRAQGSGRVLLIDCGAMHAGYASDITRTWTREGCDGLFRDLVAGMDRLQRELCDAVRPGLAYPDLHRSAHLAIADLLHQAGLIRAEGEDAVARGLTRPFFPHGLGHFLGIQVHDVAGRQEGPAGGEVPPPAEHPFLRTTRTIEEHQLFTIEPGLYFIEMLLRPHRDGSEKQAFDWKTIDRLAPHGGIRIEDNVLVTADGHRNLTRPHLG